MNWTPVSVANIFHRLNIWSNPRIAYQAPSSGGANAFREVEQADGDADREHETVIRFRQRDGTPARR